MNRTQPAPGRERRVAAGIRPWFSQLSLAQRLWLWGTVAAMLMLVAFGILMKPVDDSEKPPVFGVDMSIRDIAPHVKVTGKALARELGLPLDVRKEKPVRALGVTPEELQHAVDHLLSHRDKTLKYYIYGALVLGGLVFLVRLGRPDGSDVQHRRIWYPQAPRALFLVLAVLGAGFMLGKSPNPMEAAVKVFKSMVGLYSDPVAKVVALLFFIVLALVGNKMICGWACPFGALQDLIHSVPLLRRIKKRKLPFALTNTIRAALFAITLLLLFGAFGGGKGTVIYHYINPFNLFNLDFEGVGVVLRIAIVTVASLIVYRPFCHLICPFGFLSWLVEGLSIFRVTIDKDKCAECGRCAKACPSHAMAERVRGKLFPADCFSCARCLNVCPVDALRYEPLSKQWFFRNKRRQI